MLVEMRRNVWSDIANAAAPRRTGIRGVSAIYAVNYISYSSADLTTPVENIGLYNKLPS